MPFAARHFGNSTRAPFHKGIPSISKECNAPQVLRYRSNFARLPLHKQCRHGAIHPFSTPRRLDLEQTLSRNYFHPSARRGYATSSRGLIRRSGTIIVTLTLVAGLAYLVFSIAEAWIYIHPPQLDNWPEELREHLSEARVALGAKRHDLLLDHFERAWTAAQRIPAHVHNPDVCNKILSIAIWFADVLEKNGQAHKAYKVLADAVTLHDSRFEKTSSTTDPASVYRTNVLNRAKLEEKCHLVSIYTKISSLSRKYEPKAEGKWLSRAIREMFTVLPFCKADPEKYSAVISDIKGLSTVEGSFSDLMPDLDLQHIILPIAPAAIRAEGDTNADPQISEDEVVPKDDLFLLPYWHASDMAYAISLPLEQLGVYAANHGYKEYVRTNQTWCGSVLLILTEILDRFAYAAYHAATTAIRSTLTNIPVPTQNASVEDWRAILQILRITNRKVELFLRALESEIHPPEWLSYLHEAYKESRTAEVLSKSHSAMLKTRKAAIEWRQMLLKEADLLNDRAAQCATFLKHRAICEENLGKSQEAMTLYEGALRYYKKFPNVEEMSDIKERIGRLKRGMAENKTSLKSHMNPLALKEWEEQKEARRQVPQEGQATPEFQDYSIDIRHVE